MKHNKAKPKDEERKVEDKKISKSPLVINLQSQGNILTNKEVKTIVEYRNLKGFKEKDLRFIESLIIKKLEQGYISKDEVGKAVDEIDIPENINASGMKVEIGKLRKRLNL